MKTPQFVLTWLQNKTGEVALRRDPDILIGGADDPYMRRWWIVPRNRLFNIYLHHFLHSDDDTALHDHPSWNVSILLKGEYTEHTIAAGGVHHAAIYKAGQTKFRLARAAHRIELHDGPCWSLFINGAKLREWGFHCPKGWRSWKHYSGKDYGTIGRGCD